MTHPLHRIALLLTGVLFLASVVVAFPKPSPYPISWELRFEHSAPKRILVTPKGKNVAEAFWYVTYSVANLSNDEQRFLPVFEMMTEDGQIIRSDRDIPVEVLETIRAREKSPQLQSINEIGGVLRVGEDQAKDGVAIWREPTPEMGQFTIFVAGLSGEATFLKDSSGKTVERQTKDGKKEPVVLWKTYQVRYRMLGDEKFPGTDYVETLDKSWVMR